jgi:hypothetical protein
MRRPGPRAAGLAAYASALDGALQIARQEGGSTCILHGVAARRARNQADIENETPGTLAALARGRGLPMLGVLVCLLVSLAGRYR